MCRPTGLLFTSSSKSYWLFILLQVCTDLVVVFCEQKEEEFIFNDIPERPVPSILRGYSAPVRMDSDLTDADLYFLLANDSDEFNRYVIKKIACVYL